mmetsp:Transcript_45903/g.147460  ORF Transcript_45903/g.147460 Transcript_45903/m.147460 type:complete len:271 (+) Transcript_45903:1359-2171(+)
MCHCGSGASASKSKTMLAVPLPRGAAGPCADAAAEPPVSVWAAASSCGAGPHARRSSHETGAATFRLDAADGEANGETWTSSCSMRRPPTASAASASYVKCSVHSAAAATPARAAAPLPCSSSSSASSSSSRATSLPPPPRASSRLPASMVIRQSKSPRLRTLRRPSSSSELPDEACSSASPTATSTGTVTSSASASTRAAAAAARSAAAPVTAAAGALAGGSAVELEDGQAPSAPKPRGEPGEIASAAAALPRRALKSLFLGGLCSRSF